MGLRHFKFMLKRKFEQRGEKAPGYEEIDEIIEKANKLFMSGKEKKLFSREIEKVQELWELAARIYEKEKEREDFCWVLPTYEAVFRHLKNLTYNKIYFLRKLGDIALTIAHEASKLEDYEKKIDRFKRIKGIKLARVEKIRISRVFERFLSVMDDIKDQENEIIADANRVRGYTEDMLDIFQGGKRFRQKKVEPAYTLPELIRYVENWYPGRSEQRGYEDIWDDFKKIRAGMHELKSILVKEISPMRNIRFRISRLKRKETKIVKLTGRRVRKAKRMAA
ncbi:hypothetical protein KY331_02690 [Candidatus Woesearchaeota archaeon]|nr:hypothetical protein [Candidatus Woesearchaeota archaeon]